MHIQLAVLEVRLIQRIVYSKAVNRGQNGASTVLVAGPGALDEAGNLADSSKLEEREVTLGRNDEAYIEVLSGLEEGETVFIQNASSANPWG